MDPEEYSHAYTPYALKKIEITDTVKQLAFLFLQIFEKCEKKSLLQSIQHINQTLFLSSGVVLHDDTKHILSATPYHILLSICDPSSLQYGDDDDHDDNCIKNTSNDNKITKEGNHSFIMLQYHARRIGQMLSSPYQEKDKTNEDEDEI